MINQRIVHSMFEQQRDRAPTGWQKGFVGCYLVVGLGALIIALVSWLSHRAPVYLFLWVGIPYLGLWFWFRWDLKNDRVCAQMMLDALANGGEQLAWVYKADNTTLPGAHQTISFHYCFTNKRHGCIYGTDETISGLFSYFITNFPQVSSGYTPELEKLFNRHPQELKTNPVRSHAVRVSITQDDNSFNGW
jgi:hypothetical protein